MLDLHVQRACAFDVADYHCLSLTSAVKDTMTYNMPLTSFTRTLPLVHLLPQTNRTSDCFLLANNEDTSIYVFDKHLYISGAHPAPARFTSQSSSTTEDEVMEKTPALTNSGDQSSRNIACTPLQLATGLVALHSSHKGTQVPRNHSKELSGQLTM